MFKITKRGTAEVIGLVDKLRYIVRDADSGTLFQAFGAYDADGIAVCGTPYNIGEEEKIPDAKFADIVEIDSGEYNFAAHNEIVKNTDDIDTMQGLILEQDNDLCSMQEALLDLDNQINGGN